MNEGKQNTIEMWCIESRKSRLVRVMVARTTEHQIVYYADDTFARKRVERRENKHSDYRDYFDTWSEAYGKLLERWQRERDAAARNLQYADAACSSLIELEPNTEWGR